MVTETNSCKDYLINGPFEWHVVLKLNKQSLETKVSFEKKARLNTS